MTKPLFMPLVLGNVDSEAGRQFLRERDQVSRDFVERQLTKHEEAKGASYAKYQRQVARRERNVFVESEVNRLKHHKARGGVFGPQDEKELASREAELAEGIALYKAMLPDEQPKRKLSSRESSVLSLIAEINPTVEDAIQNWGPRAIFVPARAKLVESVSLAALEAHRLNVVDPFYHGILDVKRSRLDTESQIKIMETTVDRKVEAPDIRDIGSVYARGRGDSVSHGQLKFPAQSAIAPDLSWSVEIEQGIGMLCWLMGDQIKERLAAMIRESNAGKPGLSMEARAQKEKALRAELLAAERVEVAMCHALEAQGLSVEWRRLNPLALFQIELSGRTEPESRHQHFDIAEAIPSYPIPAVPKGAATA